MASIIKIDNIQNTCGSNIINQCGTTVTLGASGDSVVLGAGVTATGFGRSGGVDYCTTVKTSPFTAANGSGYFVNTTCGAVTVTLPATPSAGAIIALKDYGGTWQTNNVTLCNNGSKINGVCATASLSTEGQSVTLIYVDATKGWQDINDSTSSVTGADYITATGGTITTCGDYKVHTFTSDGCFAVTASLIPANNKVDYLVIAGGAGAGNWAGGGGGAGGYRESKCACVSGCWTASPLATPVSLPVSSTTYPITIGAGGAGQPVGTNWPSTQACNGSNSIFSTITSTGGGAGGSNDRPSPAGPVMSGFPGGSGGGGSRQPGNVGGAGNTPPTSPPQGNNGGTGLDGPAFIGGGGGGATGVGGNAPSSIGGTGATSSINGTPTGRAGGGGGGRAFSGGPSPASDGGGPGGAGGSPNPGTAGTVNTGGGGGGAGSTNCSVVTAGSGGSGGSGIVVIRYKFQ